MEEVRAHPSVMAWEMVFGVVVPKFGAYGGTVNLEVALAGANPDLVEAHVNCLRPFLIDYIFEKPTDVVLSTCMGVGGWGCLSSLRVVQIGKGVFSIWKSGTNFGFPR